MTINGQKIDTDRQDIINGISQIMINKIKVPSNLIIRENYNKSLTGTVFKLRRLDLTYLFFEIEEKFGIKIDTTKILNYEFNTIHGITELILDTKNKVLI